MDRRAVFNVRLLPVALLLPQLLLTLIFFYLPAGEAVWSSMTTQDAFGQGFVYVGLDNFVDLFTDPLYVDSALRTIVFAVCVCVLSMGVALLLAVCVELPAAGFSLRLARRVNLNADRMARAALAMQAATHGDRH